MEREISRTIAAHRLFTAGETVVVAVSGGADSVALLDFLATGSGLGLRLVVAHVNHGLRGAEADDDERFVRGLAERYGLPMATTSADVRALSRQRRLSLEEAGREARYAFFEEVAGQYGAARIALAHHRDDQAETVLMRLIRGAGVDGLSGMRPRSGDGRYVRPLLSVTRRAIVGYLRKKGLAWQEDASNRDQRFLRNRVRHELLPLLASYNPAIAERLAATAESLAADGELLERLTAERYAVCRDCAGEGLAVPLLRREPDGIRLRLYRRAIAAVKGDLRRLSHRHLQAIDRLVLAARSNGALALPDGVRITRCYDALTVTVGDSGEDYGYELLVEGPGSYRLPGGWNLTVTVGKAPASWEGAALDTAWFDPVAVPFPWLVRTFRPGDRIRPFGMTGEKKVKDLLIDLKIPPLERRSLPLVFAGGVLAWVCGIRRGAVGEVAPGSDRVVVAVCSRER
ncbi:tRNA lysidine(34) synthetase TilS [Geobacter argillaceus]|nr:tRNA lysidine(34) synthetase TilS [Geobacter argillaceus]